jgi:hypothetical protein
MTPGKRAKDLHVERAAIAATELSLARCAELYMAVPVVDHGTDLFAYQADPFRVARIQVKGAMGGLKVFLQYNLRPAFQRTCGCRRRSCSPARRADGSLEERFLRKSIIGSVRGYDGGVQVAKAGHRRRSRPAANARWSTWAVTSASGVARAA